MSLTIADYEEALADTRRLAREIDVALHGEENAAKQASLCDLVPLAHKLREERDQLLAIIAEKIRDRGRELRFSRIKGSGKHGPIMTDAGLREAFEQEAVEEIRKHITKDLVEFSERKIEGSPIFRSRFDPEPNVTVMEAVLWLAR